MIIIRYKTTSPHFTDNSTEELTSIKKLFNYIEELKCETEAAISLLTKQIDALKAIKEE